jgi:hypothetical protein
MWTSESPCLTVSEPDTPQRTPTTPVVDVAAATAAALTAELEAGAYTLTLAHFRTQLEDPREHIAHVRSST